MKFVMIVLTLLLFCFVSFGQDFRKNPGYRFSKEDINEFLLYQSKKDKTKGIVTFITGTVLTGIGVYISNNSPAIRSSNSQRVIYPSTIGKVIGTTGLITTFFSIPFFMSASKSKKIAQSVLSDQMIPSFRR